MAFALSIKDHSTPLELVFKEWMDAYPPEKVAAIQETIDALDSALSTTREKLDPLKRASASLDNLYAPLPAICEQLLKTEEARKNFITAFDDGGIPFPFLDMTHTLHSYISAIEDYRQKVSDSFLSNISLLEDTLKTITHLRDFYSSLLSAITIIRDQFFKEKPDRRKPIVRELYRIFSALSSETTKVDLAPLFQNIVILDKAERDNLIAIKNMAELTAQNIKKMR